MNLFPVIDFGCFLLEIHLLLIQLDHLGSKGSSFSTTLEAIHDILSIIPENIFGRFDIGNANTKFLEALFIILYPFGFLMVILKFLIFAPQCRIFRHQVGIGIGKGVFIAFGGLPGFFHSLLLLLFGLSRFFGSEDKCG